MFPPRRKKNIEMRPREWLTHEEVMRLSIAASLVGRYGLRDRLLVLCAYFHGLRITELANLTWASIDLDGAVMYVSRIKSGLPSVHPIPSWELEFLLQHRLNDLQHKYVFMTERGSRIKPTTIRKIVKRAGITAAMEFPIHTAMLRPSYARRLASCGYDLRTIRHLLGHNNIQSTMRSIGRDLNAPVVPNVDPFMQCGI